jgi:WD40 repeat protein
MNLEKAKHLWELPFEGAWVQACTFVGNSRQLAAGNRNGQMYLWELPESPATADSANQDQKKPASLAPTRSLHGHTNAITHIISSADGSTLYSASLDRTIRIWNPAAPKTGTDKVVMDIDTRKAEAKRLRKDDPLKAPGVKVEVVKATRVIDDHKDWIKALALSHDGSRLVSGDDSGTIIVWDTAKWKQLQQIKVRGWVTALAISPDGRHLLVAERIQYYGSRRYRSITIWDMAAGKQIKNLKADKKAKFTQLLEKMDIGSAAYSPDGKYLALGQEGEAGQSKVLLLDAESGELIQDLSAHKSGVNDVRFSPDSQLILSSGRDTVIRAHNVGDGKQVAELGKPRGGQFKDWFNAIALSPQHHLIATGDMAGRLHVWGFDP